MAVRELAELKLDDTVNKSIYILTNALDFSKKTLKQIVIALSDNIP